MNPTDLVRKSLGEDVWNECHPSLSATGDLSPSEDLSPFQTSKAYIVYGRTNQFDFPTLPGGSYCIYDANGARAIRLTRAGKEIETLLADNWPALPQCDPVKLARLVLTFFDEGTRATHAVLADGDALRSYGEGPLSNYYVLNEREMTRVEGMIGATNTATHGDTIVLRTVTLCGWKHDKRNLGIEHIRIARAGKVELEKREVLSKRIFKSVPAIRY